MAQISRDSFENPISAFTPLPDEVLQQIIYYLPPHDILLNINLISKRFNRLGNASLLWRYHCHVDFKYWDAKHQIRQKFADTPGNVDWKSLYIYRDNIESKTTKLLNSILETRANRIMKFEEIGKFGYDAKDTLLRHCRTLNDHGDQLARTFYARAVLDSMHRAEALKIWARLAGGEDVPTETALGVYDMFILHEHPGDILETSDILDDIAARIRSDCLEFNRISTRQQALEIVKFLRMHNLVGLDSEVAYRDLQNNYIGLALQEPEHPSLPLISVAIFCAVSRRLGVDARFCAMPTHVQAMVFPKPLMDLDGKMLEQENPSPQPMYLDPYRSDMETPSENLERMLAAWGVRGISSAEYIAKASHTINLVLRTTRNILTTIQGYRYEGPLNHTDTRLNETAPMDLGHAIYSSLWANFFLDQNLASRTHNNRGQFVPMLLSRFEKSYPEDVTLIEKYVLPTFSNSHNEYSDLSEALKMVRAVDSRPRQVRTRSSFGETDKVKFRVGKVFCHRRYGYTAVIVGWDVECGMDPTWIADHQIDNLKRGRHQSFYHVLVADASIRYVAEDNIEIVEKPDVGLLLKVAGQYFKQYDEKNCRFIANFKDEYPDD